MALLNIQAFSSVLDVETSIHVVSPKDRLDNTRRVMFFLHGAADNATTIARRTNIEDFAHRYGCTVIMPNGHKSYYTDMANGMAYYTYVAEELPELCRRLLGIEPAPADTCLVGISMGGYGALKLALRHPEKYAKVASLSGVALIQERLAQQLPPHRLREMKGIFGEQLVINPEDDLEQLLEAQSEKLKTMPVLMMCGRQDPFYGMNAAFAEMLHSRKLPVQFIQTDGGHDWAYWNSCIPELFHGFFGEEIHEHF